MKSKIDAKEWAEDYKLFIEASPMSPPTHLKEKLFAAVHRDLNPSFSLVLAKLSGIHILGGSISLMLCSQFGIGNGYNLMHVFMSQGIFVCMTLCGALFLGLTILLAGFILSSSELKKIRKTCYAPIVLLGVVSLTILLFFGAAIALKLALFWLLGAIAAGALFTEASIRIKGYGLSA